MKSPMFIRGAAFAGALALSHASVALAAAGGENTPLNLPATGGSPVHSAGGGGSSIVRTIVGLFVVIAVIYGISWVLRQTRGSKNRPSGQGLSQIASLPLGSGKSVALVRAGQEIVLVGLSENSVTPIRTYTEAEALSLGLELPSEDGRLTPVSQEERSMGRVVDRLRRLTVRS